MNYACLEGCQEIKSRCLFRRIGFDLIAMSVPQINLNTTLGAAFVGHTVATALFGITSLQTFIFFKGNTKDRKWFKDLILLLWIIDFLHQIFMTHGVYDYLILNFGNAQAFSRPTWSLLSQVLTTCLSDLIVRSVFARRVWLLSGHKRILLFLIVTASVFVFAMGVAFAVRALITMSFLTLIQESWLLYGALGGSVVADGLITASLCKLLSQQRTGFKSTDSLITTLMLYSINTGLLTSVCATACFVTFAIWPHQFVFMGIYFALGKLYINSLLAVLNTRESLRRRNSGMTSIPQSPSSIEPFTMNFAAATALSSSEPQSSDVTKPRPSKLAWRDSSWK
ncbi:hypothetical protein CPB84DRAFT_1961064 [Gymnopilus junonius]|uniref:DUF6534 domain-containing protein n=1 Tax=Gymnopilus junonius TaxID=109634 RepID=A0A9P5NTZ5_GYMJU|nr:hypothetical protein CPB84DRAFT_1961064 [Gymnopilus junonius]